MDEGWLAQQQSSLDIQSHWVLREAVDCDASQKTQAKMES
jgi:hypothetical protein